MTHNTVNLEIPATHAFEEYESGVGTVLYVAHYRETPEAICELRELLNPLRSPDGRYERIWLKSKSTEWTA
jgi:hypothetical protein